MCHLNFKTESSPKTDFWMFDLVTKCMLNTTGMPATDLLNASYRASERWLQSSGMLQQSYRTSATELQDADTELLDTAYRAFRMPAAELRDAGYQRQLFSRKQVTESATGTAR